MENPFSALPHAKPAEPAPQPEPALQAGAELPPANDEVNQSASNTLTVNPQEPKPAPKHLPKPVVQNPDASPTVHHQPAVYAPAVHAEGWSDADFDDHDGSKLPALAMEEKSCRMCKYFHFEDAARHEIRFGECRRSAPNGVGKAMWPSVLWNSWCGEWEMGVDQGEMMQMARQVGEGVSIDS